MMSRKRSAEARGDERGFVLVWMAAGFIVLLGFAGLALDIANWYLTANRSQKAADAAALAGAVYLPDDPATAIATAKDVARINGFDDAAGDIVVTATPKPSNPSQLDDQVSRTVKNAFGRLIGNPQKTVTRGAVGEYERPVPLGSPSNVLGNEPCSIDGCVANAYQLANPSFWINVAGPQSYKANGDAVQASLCGTNTDSCPTGGANADYNPNGYSYTVKVGTPPIGKPLVIEAFDPAFVNVGDNCTDAAVNLAGAAALPLPNAAIRYAPGNASPFCTGDQDFAVANQVPPTTVFTVREDVNGTPWNPNDDALITGCQSTFQGYIPGHYGNPTVAEMLDPTYAGFAPADRANVTAWFRKWVLLCTVVNPQPGDYVVQIQGNGDPNGGGHNRLALRASFAGGTSVENAQLGMFANSFLGIYANAQAANINFHLVRVQPSGTGRILHLRFFDTGDASQAGTLQILPPPLATGIPTGLFQGCQYTPPPGSPMSPTGPDCTITNVISTTYNGQWVEMTVPIPAGYSCTSSDPGDCWLRIKFNFPSNVSDTTTWQAWIERDPVRLVA
jgi:Flp pilus assembly protein TadG